MTYTQNWPHEPLVGNTPTGSAVVWSVISFVLLLAGVGVMVWYFAAQERGPAHPALPTRDPLLGLENRGFFLAPEVIIYESLFDRHEQ